MPAPFTEQSEATDLAACAELLRGGSRSFHAASLLLPARIRAPACALYAFCRLADDAIDLHGAPVSALALLRERLRLVYAGRPAPLAADRALAATVARFAIPKALLDALIEGFEWDSTGRRYETLAELRAYAARVAGSVGAMMAQIMGVTRPETVARACELGIAMQLSNIARDVGEDARAGRLYLPLEWLRESGIDPDDWLRRPRFTAEIGAVTGRLLVEADRLYRQATAGIAELPPDCRPGIRAARFLYAEIGREVERAAFDSVSRRVVVSAPRKLWLLARSFLAVDLGRTRVRFDCLAEARFLVDAVAAATPRIAAAAPSLPWWNLDERAAWVFELFERLERQEQLGRSRS
jgi:phytoene synthase